MSLLPTSLNPPLQPSGGWGIQVLSDPTPNLLSALSSPSQTNRQSFTPTPCSESSPGKPVTLWCPSVQPWTPGAQLQYQLAGILVALAVFVPPLQSTEDINNCSTRTKANDLLNFFVYLFLLMLQGIWDLSSPRDRTHAPCSGSTES